jgi:hypothetical protein
VFCSRCEAENGDLPVRCRPAATARRAARCFPQEMHGGSERSTRPSACRSPHRAQAITRKPAAIRSRSFLSPLSLSLHAKSDFGLGRAADRPSPQRARRSAAKLTRDEARSFAVNIATKFYFLACSKSLVNSDCDQAQGSAAAMSRFRCPSRGRINYNESVRPKICDRMIIERRRQSVRI